MAHAPLDPELIEGKVADELVCTICCMIMYQPLSGCADGHTYCSPCLRQVVKTQKRCPECRRTSKPSDLRRNRPIEKLIADLPCHCSNATPFASVSVVGTGGGAKRARTSEFRSLTVAGLRDALTKRGLDSTGIKTDLVSRRKPAGTRSHRLADPCLGLTHVTRTRHRAVEADVIPPCEWHGTVDRLAAHLRGECPNELCACPHASCEMSVPRCRLAAHTNEFCVHRPASCPHAGCRAQALPHPPHRPVATLCPLPPPPQDGPQTPPPRLGPGHSVDARGALARVPARRGRVRVRRAAAAAAAQAAQGQGLPAHGDPLSLPRLRAAAAGARARLPPPPAPG